MEPRTVLAWLAWLGLVSIGFRALYSHQAAPGENAASARAPNEAGLPFAFEDERHTLLVFAHPDCPCTTATIGELDRLLADVGDGMRCYVLLWASEELGDWRTSRIGSRVAGLRGVTELPDLDARWARALGVATSGQVLLYAPGGELVFEGGITPGRGHSGDSLGRSAILDHVLTGEGASSAPVFGCTFPLEDAS